MFYFLPQGALTIRATMSINCRRTTVVESRRGEQASSDLMTGTANAHLDIATDQLVAALLVNALSVRTTFLCSIFVVILFFSRYTSYDDNLLLDIL